MDSPAAGGDTAFGLVRVVGQLRDEFVSDFEAELARHHIDLNFIQYLVLRTLGTRAPMTAIELSRALRYSSGSMTRVLDKLERGGYVTRTPHPADRRAVQLALTRAGQALRRSTTRHCDDVARRTFADTQPAERRQAHAVLTRALHALRTRHAAAS